MSYSPSENDNFLKGMYFPTIIFKIQYHDHEILSAHLLDAIYRGRDQDKHGIERSNFRSLGDWHSHNNLHKDTAYQPLTDRIIHAGHNISVELGYRQDRWLRIGTMWSIINTPGSSNKTHIHPDSHWSGIYYVQTPEKVAISNSPIREHRI